MTFRQVQYFVVVITSHNQLTLSGVSARSGRRLSDGEPLAPLVAVPRTQRFLVAGADSDGAVGTGFHCQCANRVWYAIIAED